ncbi:MAG: PilW family protein [Propionivibrio sp.]
MTLVEMMVAMAIGLFMTGIIAGLYINMRGSFRYQEDFARLQENGRFAMETLTRDIRMAGYNGCGNLTDFANVVNGGSNDPTVTSQIPIYLNFQKPVFGYEGNSLPTALTDAGAINIAGGPDALILLGVDSSSELVVQDHQPQSSSYRVNTRTHSIKTGEVLLIADCSHATVFQVTGPGPGQTYVEHNDAGGTATPGNCTKYLGASCSSPNKSYQYKPGASLFRIYSRAYFIAPSPSGSSRSLYAMDMTGQTTVTPPEKNELIEGVENMQVTYGLDTNGDRSADQFVAANSVANWSQVVSVRVSILAASKNDNISSTVQTYEYDNSSVTATDRKVRKVFTETVAVRNRTP